MYVIKQYGLERTGTNYIKGLLDINIKDCRVLGNLFGLKHEPFNPKDIETKLDKNYHPKKDDELDFGKYVDISDRELEIVKDLIRNGEVKYLVMIKDPYSWVSSYNDCHWLAPKHGFEYGPISLPKVKSYMGRWNSVYNNWVNTLPSDKTLFISYEDLIIDPQKVIEGICSEFNLTMSGEFKNIKNNMGMTADIHGSRNTENWDFSVKKQYYLTKEYMDRLTDEMKDYIKNNTDNKILEKITLYNEGIDNRN